MTSGKGAVQYFLVDRGFEYIRNTEPIFEEGQKRKMDMSNRQNWLDIIVQMRKKKGADILAKEASKKIDEESRYVIAPIRHPIDIKYLKKKYNALIIYVDAPLLTRYKRTFLSESGRGMTKDEFLKKDASECSPTGSDKEYLPHISACKKLADEIISNDGSLNDLNSQLEKILRKYNIPDIEDKGYQEGFDV
jgi:dephospho-CoA kinase